MMTRTTPLAEVARLLPAFSAQVLMTQDSIVQEIVLSSVRSMMVSWEENGVLLDPIQFEAVLTQVVMHMAAAVGAAQDIATSKGKT